MPVKPQVMYKELYVPYQALEGSVLFYFFVCARILEKRRHI
jgi:hypothetical protein